MPPTPLPSLTLIVAAERSLGIGRAGGLPWPQLRQEMGYFARVTKRVASPINPNSKRQKVNAVVMGRRTWDSIPERFRPLRGRLNVVVTREAGSEKWGVERERVRKSLGEGSVEGPVVVGSLEGALEVVQRLQSSAREEEIGDGDVVPDVEVDRTFIIGGASLYASALKMPATKRVLLTQIYNEFECDTFWPLDLFGEEGKKVGWVQKSGKELEEWTGEKGAAEEVEEKGVGWRYCLLERESS
jgi:dihydrofolate reductase